MKFWPAIVNTPLRNEEAAFAAMEKLTVVLPSPLVAEVMVIQLLGLLMLQAQPAGAVRETAPLPPLEGKEALVDPRE